MASKPDRADTVAVVIAIFGCIFFLPALALSHFVFSSFVQKLDIDTILSTSEIIKDSPKPVGGFNIAGKESKGEIKSAPLLEFLRGLFKLNSPSSYKVCLENNNVLTMFDILRDEKDIKVSGRVPDTVGAMSLYVQDKDGLIANPYALIGHRDCKPISTLVFSYRPEYRGMRFWEDEVGPQNPPVVIHRKDELTLPDSTNSRAYTRPDTYSYWLIFISIFTIWSAGVLFLAKVISVSISWSKKVLNIE